MKCLLPSPAGWNFRPMSFVFFFPTFVISFSSFGASSEPVCITGSDLSECVFFVFVRIMERHAKNTVFFFSQTWNHPLLTFTLIDIFFTFLYYFHFSSVPFLTTTPGQTPPNYWIHHVLALFQGQIANAVCFRSRAHTLVKWKQETPGPALQSSSPSYEKTKKKNHMAHICIIRSSQTSVLTWGSVWSEMCAAWLHLCMFHLLSALYTEIKQGTSAEEENVSISPSQGMCFMTFHVRRQLWPKKMSSSHHKSRRSLQLTSVIWLADINVGISPLEKKTPQSYIYQLLNSNDG